MTHGLHWKPTDADGLRWELWTGERRYHGRVTGAGHELGGHAIWINGFGAVLTEHPSIHAAARWLLGRATGGWVGTGAKTPAR